jgi:hypothetical protein
MTDLQGGWFGVALVIIVAISCGIIASGFIFITKTWEHINSMPHKPVFKNCKIICEQDGLVEIQNCILQNCKIEDKNNPK